MEPKADSSLLSPDAPLSAREAGLDRDRLVKTIIAIRISITTNIYSIEMPSTSHFVSLLNLDETIYFINYLIKFVQQSFYAYFFSISP